MELGGRVAMVTGAGAGIGRAVALALAREGASVVAVDVLVNNAGGVSPPFFPDAPPERWSAVLDVNLRATMLGIQLALETMRGRGGAIVNVSSIAGVGYGAHGGPGDAPAKTGVARLTAALA